MKFCLKCKNTGRVLEKRLSEYVNSYDYYPVPCPDCTTENMSSLQNMSSLRKNVPSTHKNSFHVVVR